LLKKTGVQGDIYPIGLFSVAALSISCRVDSHFRHVVSLAGTNRTEDIGIKSVTGVQPNFMLRWVIDKMALLSL
jgi:hypothetical protein